MKNVVLIALLTIAIIFVSGCVQEGTTDLARAPSGEIGTNPYDTTCGGIYAPIPNGTTDSSGKYVLVLENGENGTIIVKDAVTAGPVEGIGIVFLVDCEQKPRTLGSVNFHIIERVDYNTDLGTITFTTSEGVLIIPKTAHIPDAESAITAAKAAAKVQEWMSTRDRVYPNADVRLGKWRIYFQGENDACPDIPPAPENATSPSYGTGISGCSGGFLTVYVDPKTGEVTDYFESNP